MVEIHKTTKCETTPPTTSFLPSTLFKTAAITAVASSIPKVASSINIQTVNDGGIAAPKTSHSFSSIGEFSFQTLSRFTDLWKSFTESAFDSNQSVAGSSVEVLSECSSQVSQTSQSSIEVLDSSRKPSEERRISIVPSLDTIEDDGPKNVLDETLKKPEELKPKVVLSIGSVNLTESSSSGSVCESVVTAYEHSGSKKSGMETSLDNIYKTSSMLLSKTPKPKSESESEQAANNHKAIQYNNDDLSIIDHRVKLFLYQNVLEDNEEKLMWLVKTLVIEDDASSSGVPFMALIVMSQKKVYILRIVGDESEEISKWLKKVSMNSIDRIESIQEITSKLGFTFTLKSSARIHLLLQDHNLTDRLRIHISTSSKLNNCDVRPPLLTLNLFL